MNFGKLFLMVGLFVFSSWANAIEPVPTPAWDCAKLMEVVEDDLLAKSLSQFSSVEAEVIAGAKVPTWSDFNALSNLISQFQIHEAQYADDGKLDQLQVELKKLEALLLEQFQFNPNFTTYPVSAELESGALGLVQAYRQALIDLNQLFPERVQFTFNEIPQQKVSSEQVIELATAMVTKQKQRIEASLVRINPEIKTWRQFQKKTEEWVKQQAPNSGYAELYQILSDPKNLLISMRRPESARFWLPMTGFQNQRVTGTSRGSLTRTGRDAYEARSFGINERIYSQLRSDLKPNYGYLRLAGSVPFAIPDGATGYGSDIYDYDYDKIKDRVTFTMGDSLSYFDPDALTFARSMTPIQYLRYVISGLAFYPTFNGFTQVALGRLKISTTNFYVGSSYLELQIWGPDFLDYVKRFTFTQNPPSPEFVAELQSRGIEIFDGRNGTRNPLPWKSPEDSKKKITSLRGEVLRGPSLPVPDMIAPDLVKPFVVSSDDILSLFPDATPTDISFHNGIGILQTNAMKSKGLFYGIVAEYGSKTLVLPVSTDISKIEAEEELYYSIDNQGVTSGKVGDLDINPYRSVSLFHFNEVFDGGDLWTESLNDVFSKGEKIPNLIRLILKKQSPIKMIASNQLVSLQKTGDLNVSYYEPAQDLDDFKVKGTLPWFNLGERPSMRAVSTVTARSRLEAVSIGVTFLGNALRNILDHIPKPADPTEVQALQLRSNNLTQELRILGLIEARAPAEQVKNYFAALHPGPCETDLYDTESFKVVVQDYIDGKL